MELTRMVLQCLRKHPSVRIFIVVDPYFWNSADDPNMQAIRDSLRSFAFEKGQVIIENDRNPRAGRLGMNIGTEGTLQQNNFLLFSDLKSQSGKSHGSSVVLLSEGFGKLLDRRPGHLLDIHGDLGLYDAYLAYWGEMAESRLDFAFREVRTYSNLHDHRAYFFPNYEGIDPTLNWVGGLMKGIEDLGSPAKVRLWMRSEKEPESGKALLGDLEEKYEADVKSMYWSMPVDSQMEADSIKMVEKWRENPGGGMFLLLDGPISATQEALPERHRVVFIGSHTWDEAAMNQHSNNAVAIFNKELYDSLSSHWRLLE